MVRVIKKISVPLGVLFAIVSVPLTIASMIQPWSCFSKVLVSPVTDAYLQVMVLGSILTTIGFICFCLKSKKPVPLLIISLVIDLVSSSYATFGADIRVYVGYYLFLLASLTKGVALTLILLNIGILEIELVEDTEQEGS